MKKTLLLLAVALLSSAASFAQWVKPTLPAPETTTYAETTEDAAAEATAYYLYNVDGGAFYGHASSWGTRACLVSYPQQYMDGATERTAEPMLVRLVRFAESESLGIQWVKADGKTDYTSPDAWNGIWVDGKRQGYDLFTVSNLDEVHFTISIDDVLDGGVLGVLSSDVTPMPELNLYVPADVTDADLYSTWALVTAEAYEAVRGEEILADFKVKYDTYYAAVALKAYLDKAAEEGNGADLSAEWAIYNNGESTLEQLQAALASATQKCVDWSASQASVENPKDVTDMLENPTFDVIGDFHGWKGTSFAAGGTTSTCAEHYNKNYDTYQDVNGGKDIPNGIYKVSVYGFYRAGSLDNDYATRDKAEYRHAKLYAYTPKDTLYTGVPALSTWAIEDASLGGLQIGTTGLYVPNSMLDFTNWEDAGKGHDVELIVPVLDGKLRIGAKKEVLIDTDWSIFDNFSLTYYGNGVDAYQMWRDQVLATILADMDTYDWENIYYERAARAEFEAAIKAARAATTPEEIHTLTVGITAIVERVLASISTYTELAEKWPVWKETISNYSGDLVSDFLDREEEVMNVLENGELSTAEVRTLIDELQAQYDYAIKNSLAEGDDCTNMITNADFKQGKTGWTNAAGAAFAGTHGGLKAFPAGEVYEGVVDVQQTITGVPAGLYSVSVKAFERPAGNGSYTGEEESKVFLFMGGLQTPVQNIAKDAQPEATAENYVNCFKEGSINEDYYSTGGTTNNDYLMEGFGYVPNGMSGASYAFRAGRYEQHVFGLVGDDGIMKIGLTSNGATAHWVLWSDFHLTFEGKNVEGLREALEPTVSGIMDYVNEREGSMSLVGSDYASSKAGDIMDTYESSEDYDELAALVDEITALKAYIEENIKMVDAYNAAYDALGEATETYGDTASEDLVNEAIELYDNAIGPQDDEISDEEVKAAIAAMVDMVERLRIPAYEDASDNNPIDMTSVIVNPTFDEGNYNGWTLVKREGASGNYQTQNGFYEGTKAMEFWSATQGQGTKFDFYQDINRLPAGTYELSADAANSLNGQARGAGEGAVYLYAGTGTDAENMSVLYNQPVEVQEAGCADAYNNYSVTFKVEEGQIVRVGIQNIGELSARWAMVDNFKLLYYGAESTKELTAIDTIESVATPVAIFDLAGRRVVKAVKGIYIINGKKVVK